MDAVARHLGMDPMQLRLINAYRDGDMKAHRKKVEGAALVEVIQAAAREIGHDAAGAVPRHVLDAAGGLSDGVAQGTRRRRRSTTPPA